MRKEMSLLAVSSVFLVVSMFALVLAESKVIIGCLQRGESAGVYLLTKEGTGESIEVIGTPDLEKHAKNHKVKLTGAQQDVGGKTVFRVTSVELISDQCEPTS